MDDDGDTDHDRRMFFDKSTAAFRAGVVAGTQWDLVNRGIGSVGMGVWTTASGNFSTALGLVTTAGSYVETATGIYNTEYTPNSTTAFDSSDRLFVIGNGTGNVARSDALIIFKNGDATLSGTLTQLSDVQLKNNINSLDQSLVKLLKLQGVNYYWNDVKPHDTESLQTGLIAQEVEKILPELVNQGSDGYKSVNYIGLIPHLIEAVKELKTENEQIKHESDQKIKSLEGRLLKLESLIEE
jgi:hypothetical protein